ncbi:MAG: XrtN system VIT domain-containing protein, partial [Bacteroidota bacterium]
MNPEATLSAAQPPAAKPFFTPMVVIGLILNAISLLLFLLPYWNPELRGQDLFSDDGALFWANYLMAALYFIALLIRGIFQKRWKFMLLPRAEYLLALSLFSISAFALNLNMQLFATFAGWAQVAIVLMHVALIGFCLVDRLPAWLRYPLFGLMGLSTVMALYFTLCLLPLMPIGVIGAILFGISLHAIAPLVFLITLIVQFWRNQNNAWDIASYTTGIVLPFLVLGVFLVRWNNVAEAIHDARASIVTRPDNTLPTWVLLAQQLPGDAFTEKVLTSRLVYQKVDLFDWNFDRRLNNTFDDLNRHDPMVNIARLFFADIRLDDEQLLKVVSARFDARHESHRKLWPGANLLTSDVFNEIQVMPDYRMAYLEKTIVIHYDSRERRRRWNNQEEALYTFYLPEGAVATSLSLWVNGEERKSRLSTRNKADSAYSTIVGRFRRDPALLHWQEGNRLTVTVFPCTPEEDRQFKIGLTVPLEHREDRLVLKNVYFRGPSIQNARETSVVRFVGENPPANPNLPSGFDANGVGEYLYSGSYQAYWEADFPVTPLSEKPFAFLGKSYHLEPWTPREEAFDPQEIYLDLNARWEASEVDAVLTLAGDRKVYAFDDRLITVTAQNRKLITDKLLKRGFSLFPLETVKHPTRALMVSKSELLSPNLKEMDG